jgi:tRNA1(Val) A37 N6-methylase TrmN6
VIDEALVIMQLKPTDVVAELGSGDGYPAIRMARETGCRVVGVEIDPAKVAESRVRVAAAGLADKITIIEGDVLDFDPKAYGATAVYAYLDPLLLNQIVPALSVGRIAVCPGHKPDGLATRLVGQCYVRN